MSDDLFNLPKDHDPGGRVRLRVGPATWTAATFSDDRKHRFTLERRWTGATELDPFALWIGMNPSTADEYVDDTTVRRETTYTRTWKLHRYVKVNICSYRATNPYDILEAEIERMEKENLKRVLLHALDKRCRRVLLAFGNVPSPLVRSRNHLLKLLRKFDVEAECLGITKNGWPRHPSRLAHGIVPSIWHYPSPEI